MSHFTPIHTSTTIRELERAAPAELLPLMARAGAVAAEHARRMLGADPRRPGQNVLVVAGPGNNGGDALEVAVHLKASFYRVTVVLVGANAGTPERLPGDAKRAYAKWLAAGGSVRDDVPAPVAGSRWDLVVDGLFGIGLTRPLDGRLAELVGQINALRVPVLALDIPSGIHADTGAVMGCAVRATETVTFIALKPGLLTLDGPDHCGSLHCDTLGLDLRAMMAPPGELLDAGVRRALAPRARNFHKGNAGNVAVIGGADGMLGAAFLAARAAIRTGAGKVFLGLLATDSAPAWDPLQPELMLRRPAAAMDEAGVILAGPGMGLSGAAVSELRSAVAIERALVLDADALSLIAGDATLARLTAARRAPTLMTPHPAEAARLLGVPTAEVQRDRLAAAIAIATRYRSVVVLKGNGSIITAPAGAGDVTRWWINASGNPGMASAGMGDALAGIAASLLAQGLAPLAAMQLAVWVHGAAADECVALGNGPLGITASDVIDAARRVLNRAGS